LRRAKGHFVGSAVELSNYNLEAPKSVDGRNSDKTLYHSNASGSINCNVKRKVPRIRWANFRLTWIQEEIMILTTTKIEDNRDVPGSKLVIIEKAGPGNAFVEG
jgi:hypothetical protein